MAAQPGPAALAAAMAQRATANGTHRRQWRATRAENVMTDSLRRVNEHAGCHEVGQASWCRWWGRRFRLPTLDRAHAWQAKAPAPPFFMKFRGRNAHPNRPRKAMVCPTLILLGVALGAISAPAQPGDS